MLEKIAAELRTAEAIKIPIAPLTEQIPEITVQDAYDIQMINAKYRLAKGAKLIGRKVGLTSLAMQKMLAVNEPDYGCIFDNMIYEQETDIALDNFIQPKIEAELAFLLKQDIKGPRTTILDVFQAVEYVVLVFEIIDSRIENWKLKIQDTVADNGSSGGVIISSSFAKLENLKLAQLGLTIRKNGAVVAMGTGAAVMGNPLRPLSWLANKLSAAGSYLKKGDLILAGSFTQALNIEKNDYFEAEFDHLGSVRAIFK